MRKRSVEVLARVCAAFPKRAVVNALIDTKKLSKNELERLVDGLKASAVVASPAPSSGPKARPKADGSPAARIMRILMIEAGLTPAQSMTALEKELASAVAASLPPLVGSFEKWLNAVLAALPAGEVLNAAMMVARRTRK